MYTFQQLKKLAKNSSPEPGTIKVALLANSASQMLATAIKGYHQAAALSTELWEADYNQIEALVYQPSSPLFKFAPKYILLDMCTEKWMKKFYSAVPLNRGQFAEQYIAHYQEIIQAIWRVLPTTKIIGNTLIEYNDDTWGSFANKINSSATYQLKLTNLKLMELAQQHPQLHLADYNSEALQLGLPLVKDSHQYFNADMAYSIDFLPHIAALSTKIIQAIEGRFVKCIVLDLDNTTWGGIIGDDGMEGIQIGSLGMGKVFTEFQQWLKHLNQRGILLAVCSKNTEHIAKEPFESHPEMILRLNDIAVFVANWESKVNNILHIQKILNIGFDSMVFLDDNPHERGVVRSAIPDIIVPELPDDPTEYVRYLQQQHLFETANFSANDEERTLQYQQEAKRVEISKSFTDEAGFLQSLCLQATVESFSKFNIPRVAQLSARSNQFNLRTVRYSEAELLQISSENANITLALSLADKLGNYGLVAVVIAKPINPQTLFIENWFMSCRVLKLGMEWFTLKQLILQAKEKGYQQLEAEYIPTKKNGLVAQHYQQFGFEEKHANYFTLSLLNEPNYPPNYINS